MALPAIPPPLKAVTAYMRMGTDFEARDVVVAYWTRFFAVQKAMAIDRNSKEAIGFIVGVMDWLEGIKKANKDNEAISSEMVGQAHMENVALTIFNRADAMDRGGTCTMATVKLFFTAACLFETLNVFTGYEVGEEIERRLKYAKWKAAYIARCIKSGEVPVPGPVEGTDAEEFQFNVDVPQDTPRSPSHSNSNSGGGSSAPPEQPGFNLNGVGPGGFPSSNHLAGPSVTAPNPSPAGSGYSTPTPAPRATAGAAKSHTAGENDLLSADSQSQSSSCSHPAHAQVSTPNGQPISPDGMIKAQKYCKWAASALTYEDIPTAIENLSNALNILTTGKDKPAS